MLEPARFPAAALAKRRVAMLVCAAGAVVLLGACGGAVDDDGTPQRTAREIDKLLVTIAQTELVHDPELATWLGLSQKQVGYPYDTYLADRSQAAYERVRVTRLETLEALGDTPRPAVGSALARDLDVITSAYETAETLFVAGHGQTGLGVAYPYVADHMRGAYIDVPDLLTRAHKIRSQDDARAYVERAAQLSDALEDERRRLFADASAGVVPPRIILQRMDEIVGRMGAGPVETHPLVTTLENLMIGVDGLDQDSQRVLSAKLRDIVEEDVLPSYANYRAGLADLMDRSTEDAGVWRLPGGEAYYRAALTAYTDKGVRAETLHALGQQEVARLTGQLDSALAASGFTDGTVAERLQQLSETPGQIYEDTPEGQAALMARLQNYVTRAERAMPQVFDQAIKTPVTVRSVPEFLEASAPAALYNSAPADGSKPAIFEINLAHMEDWPDYSLATLVYHETFPGHHFESAFTAERLRMPLIRQMTWNVAYGEGWAAYAETLADEIGLYEDDPLGEIGYLQSMLFRAARLVSDTGIHRMQWSREQAIDYLIQTTGQTEMAMTDEVDRYIVWPGQGAAYWMGRQRILDLRDRAQKVLGPAYDQDKFHEVILSGGPRPLAIVETDVERWYSEGIEK